MSLSYANCGVNIDVGNAFVESIKPLAQSTFNKNVVSSIGGFSGLFDISNLPFRNPVLVSCTDGVGTKVVLAERLNKLDEIGVDLVAMCANDLICCGATPLFFLDYYATGHLDIQQGITIIKGIVDGCQQSGMALLGGETAEMRIVYNNGQFDLAGFAVGIVDKERIIDKNNIQVGDAIIGIASSGPHSNGYALINELVDPNDDIIDLIGPLLLKPTKIYVKPILNLINEIDVYGIAHITGGGLTENVPRILPFGTNATINMKSWIKPEIFNWIKQRGNIRSPEMLRVFNCGIGMTVIVRPEDVNDAIECLKESGEEAYLIGYVTKGLGEPCVFYNNSDINRTK